MKDDQESTLLKLQELGILHLNSISSEEGLALDAARKRLQEGENIFTILKETSKGNTAEKTCDPHDAAFTIRTTTDLMSMRGYTNEKKNSIQRDIDRLEPYGDFDPALIKELGARGISIRLFHQTEKRPVRTPDSAIRVMLSGNKLDCYVAIVSSNKFYCDSEELTLPKYSLRELNEKISKLDTQLKKINSMITTLAKHSYGIEAYLATLEDQVHYNAARDGMGHTSKISYLEGFCPKHVTRHIESLAVEFGWGVMIENPKKEDAVPSLIKHPLWVTPIKAILDVINIVPGYREQDVSALFLIFFSIFLLY